MRKPSVKALRKKLSGTVADHLDKTRAIRAVGILFPGPEMQVWSTGQYTHSTRWS
jgi:hypothetical protein